MRTVKAAGCCQPVCGFRYADDRFGDAAGNDRGRRTENESASLMVSLRADPGAPWVTEVRVSVSGERSTPDAAIMIAEARRALWVMVGVLAAIWIVQIVNAADGYRLTWDYGIQARDVGTLPHIFTAPFLHFNWSHIEDNSGPLFIFGFLAAYRGVRKFLG
jgi:membrane associated rhomboid family serine protease